MSNDLLWSQLLDQGLVSGDFPQPDTGVRVPSPWPLRVMQGAAGWLAALFLFGFVAAAFRVNDVGSALGLVCLVAAGCIFYLAPRSDFAGQFAFALSVAGQILVPLGLHSMGESSISFIVVLLEMVLAVVIPNFVHRVFTTVAAGIALSIWLGSAFGASSLAAAVVAIGVVVLWRNPILLAKRLSILESIGYGLAVALLLIEGTAFRLELWHRVAPTAPFVLWIGPIVVGLVLVYVAWELSARSLTVTVAAALVALCGVAASGIAAALLVMVLGFANGKRALMGLGILDS